MLHERTKSGLGEVRESMRPISLGVAGGMLLLLGLSPADVHVGWLDAVGPGPDVRHAIRWLPAAAGLSWTAALLVVVFTAPRPRSWIDRADPALRRAEGTGYRLRVAASLASAAVTLVLPVAGIFVFAITFAALLTVVLTRLGAAIGDLGFSLGRPGMALGGRRLRYKLPPNGPPPAWHLHARAGARPGPAVG